MYRQTDRNLTAMTKQLEEHHSLDQFPPAEARAILVHKYYLSEEAGCDVGIGQAIDDWLMHHAERWRRRRLSRELEIQRGEMKRHRWLESERAGCDLGQEAEWDWIRRFAAHWRSWYDQQG